ncbi:MAG: DUF3791 domain-containing protein [Coriobacteriales bacterium]|jgi:hypothetical protein|nr:DUF3791 domain-containing protein [Coriobacteriales bacterium]
MPNLQALSDEKDFFVYLIEKYAEKKNRSAAEILEQFDTSGMTEYVMAMYPMYHTEVIENAFADIEKKMLSQ